MPNPRALGPVSRRGILRSGLAAGGALALGRPARGQEPAPAAVPGVPRPGATQYRFQVQPTTLDPDGKQPVPGITVNGRYPGPEIRVREGATLRIAVQNLLRDEPTAIHWHGLLLPAGMDGVPDVANFPIAPQRVYVYEYPLRQSGTYWYHSHWGFQEQIGLAGPFVIEPLDEPLQVDHDVVVMLGDWLHRPPAAVFAALRKVPAAGTAPAMPMAPGATMPPGPETSPSMKMAPGQAMQSPTTLAPAAGMRPPATTAPAAGTPPGATMATGMAMGSGAKADLSDVTYDAFLLNGRGPQDPWTLAAKPGERIRLRLINAGTSTYFHVRLDGHPLQITHADGLAVEPVTVDHVLMGMAEIYDAVVALNGSGSYTLHAVAQDGSGQAIGVLHTPDVAPAPNRALPALDGRALAYTDLRATMPTTLPAGTERSFTLALGGDMSRYVWTINDQAYPKADPLVIREGERVSIALVNRTMMWHPMHLHGHFFRVLQGAADRAPLKHTVNVAPGETVRIEFTADNPGRWFFHCHNLYHLEAGMARVFEYEA